MKSLLKKFSKFTLSAILIFSVIASAFPFSVKASADKSAFRYELIQMFKTGDMTTHDVSEYGFSYKEISSIFNSVIENECLIEYYCGISIVQSTTRSSDGIILTFRLLNMDSDFLPRLKKMKATIANALYGLDDNMSEAEKALYLHDYLLSVSTYYNDNTLTTKSAGNLLAYGNGVCQAYSDAYILLLKLSGIECSHVVSNSMRHVWPVIKLDDEYYHIDPTWDDTRAENLITHKYFMRNDEDFLSLSHYGWINYFEEISSASTLYDEWFVHDVESPMFYYDSLWYYEDNNSIKCSKIDGSLTTTIINGSDQTDKNTIIDVSNGILTYSSGDTTNTVTLDSSSTPEPSDRYDIYGMTDFSSYKSGNYSHIDGNYTPFYGRICLNEYVTAFEGLSLTADISIPDYKIIIRELDKSKNLIKSVILSDNDVYTASGYVKYLGISIYDSSYKPISYNQYKQLFEDGNIFSLYSSTPAPTLENPCEPDILNDIYNMLDFSSFRYGYYNYYNGQFGDYDGRICLNDYVTAYNDITYIARCADDRFQILVREIDANGKMISSVSLKNGDSYTPGKNAIKLGISIYRSDFAHISYEQYQTLYKNGFFAVLEAVK